MNAIEAMNQKQIKTTPDVKPGDTVRVHAKIIEGSKERIQVFEGVVLRVKGGGVKQTFTVRKLSYGIGVERTFMINSPKIAKIEIKKRAGVRRAYLTYLRALRGKAAKLKDMKFDSLAVNVQPEELKPEDLAPPVAEVTDADITEVSLDEAAEVDVVEEVSTEDIAAAENSESAVDQSIDAAETDHQVAEVEEIEAGLDKAEKDLERGKSTEGSTAEKNVEDAE
jgi:large subunit ribosomal protein L19